MITDAFGAPSAVLRFGWSVVLVSWALLLGYRLVFWAVFRGTTQNVERGAILRALGIGARFDLRLALLLALPVFVLGAIPALAPAAAPALWWTWLLASWALVTLVHLLDLAHYDYLHCRVDATVVEHLDAPGIALRAAWEGFPILRGALVFAVAMALHAALLAWVVFAPVAAPAAPAAGGTWGWWLLSAALFIAGLHGRPGTKFPLRWSNAYFTPSPFVAALGLNPVLFLFSTWDNRRSAHDEQAVRAHHAEFAGALGVAEPDASRPSVLRPLVPRFSPPRPPNVVVVLVESFAGYKTGAFGNTLDPTPCIDALARESLVFDHFFAVTSPTARAVFTLLTGIPDVNAVHSASRNPMAVRQPTLVNAFEG